MHAGIHNFSMPSDDAAARAAASLRLLADPTRIKVLWALMQGESSVACLADLVGATPTESASISRSCASPVWSATAARACTSTTKPPTRGSNASWPKPSANLHPKHRLQRRAADSEPEKRHPRARTDVHG
jgi:hypothetical protein